VEPGSHPTSSSPSSGDSPASESPTPARGAFANTQYTLLERLLNLGTDGHRQAANHIMEVYEKPLQVYFLGSSFANDLGDAGDVVRGFFADRLSRPSFLHDWQLSGRRLRYWLITAFKHYLYEQRHGSNRKDRQWQSLDTRNGEHDGGEDHSPERAFHREVALSVVHLALERAKVSCEDSGHAVHWEAMLRHHLDGRTFEELSREFGIEAPRLRVMARTAGNRFRRCLREELRWPGAHAEDIDREIFLLMEVLKS
jgi:DNA-directed RNA polymerase specialized sigma24 family protein